MNLKYYFLILLLISVSSCNEKTMDRILFDDFNYTDASDNTLKQNGWSVRKSRGGPGVKGANWSKDAVTFHNEDDTIYVQLAASTEGDGKSTIQSEIVHKRKFFEGTYAARMYFSDEPEFGPDGDEVVQAFFTITPLRQPMDPDYCEVDFEYLPNGGWDDPQRLAFTTWETYKPTPWKMVAITDTVEKSYKGWHTYVVTVYKKKVTYYVDGEKLAVHGGEYYPEQVMSINFNHWFINNGLKNSTEKREYLQKVDWVLYVDKFKLTPEEVNEVVSDFKSNSVTFKDTVPEE